MRASDWGLGRPSLTARSNRGRAAPAFASWVGQPFSLRRKGRFDAGSLREVRVDLGQPAIDLALTRVSMPQCPGPRQVRRPVARAAQAVDHGAPVASDDITDHASQRTASATASATTAANSKEGDQVLICHVTGLVRATSSVFASCAESLCVATVTCAVAAAGARATRATRPGARSPWSRPLARSPSRGLPHRLPPACPPPPRTRRGPLSHEVSAAGPGAATPRPR
ncbi:MAG: hypothetical protein JWR20_2473 [Marmoricola sp.]|nr:hypothetical protein [Marmoricola sp.]